MTFEEYIEQLAKRHKEIRHLYNDEVHFLSAESAMHDSIDSTLHYPAVIVTKDSGFGYSGQPGAYNKEHEYLLFIIDYVSDITDIIATEKACNRCERILDQFLNKILSDKRTNRELLSFALEDVECDYIRSDNNNQFGVVAKLNISTAYKAKNCSKVFLDEQVFDETFDESFN